jgi:peptidoglycan/LPS O-acetylase OafA/YrhL
LEHQGDFGVVAALARQRSIQDEAKMRLIILIILIILIVGALPSWPYSTGWGYYPVGGLGTLLIIVLILALLDMSSPATWLQLEKIEPRRVATGFIHFSGSFQI